MDLTQFAFAATILIGLVNGIQLAINQDWKSFAMFCAAVVAGMLFGYLRWYGLPSIEVGLAVGLSSSGVYKIAKKLGGS